MGTLSKDSREFPTLKPTTLFPRNIPFFRSCVLFICRIHPWNKPGLINTNSISHTVQCAEAALSQTRVFVVQSKLRRNYTYYLFIYN